MKKRRERRDCLEEYLAEISKVPLLSQEEEIHLAEEIKQGNKQARERFIIANLRLVVWLAKGFFKNVGPDVSFWDLIQEGNVGLIKAVNRFDSKKECRFVTYAVPLIKREIMECLRKQNTVMRLPCNIWSMLMTAEAQARKISSERNEPMKLEDLQKALEEKGFSPKTVIAILRAKLLGQSLDAPPSLRKKGGGDRHEIIGISEKPSLEESVNSFLRKAIITQAIEEGGLTEREKFVLESRFGLNGRTPKTLKEIGLEIGVCGERIRQNEKDALNKIKKYLLGSQKNI